jgi:hypothetical protein
VLLPPPPLAPPPPLPRFTVPTTFVARPGAALAPGWTVGALIAAGWQGRIHAVEVEAGEGGQDAPPLVLKTVRPGALLAPLDREAAVGARLNALPRPSGFVRTAGVLVAGGDRTVGILLERVPGRTLEAVLADPAWADAAALTSVLRSVFGSLAAAQAALGFMHNDLRAANVMVGGRATTIIDAGLATFGETYAAGPDTLVRGLPPSNSGAAVDVAASFPPLPPSPRAARWGGRTRRHRTPRLVDAAALDAAAPVASPLESIHAAAWAGKSDVYHLLLDLAGCLDGRVWPAHDEPAVERLHDLVAHVCGVRPRGFYRRPGPAGDPSTRGGFVAPPDRPLLPGRVRAFLLRAGVGLQGRPLHALRRGALRLSGWMRPRCAALTAAEALQAPAFTGWVSWRIRTA